MKNLFESKPEEGKRNGLNPSLYDMINKMTHNYLSKQSFL